MQQRLTLIIKYGRVTSVIERPDHNGFVASCVEDVANRLGVDYSVIYKRMDDVGMIDKYLIPFYNTLHTESRENLTDSLIESLNRWEEQR